MPDDAKVEFEGGPEFAADMERLTHVLEDDLDQALVDVARGLVPRVQSVTPKVTGQLAGSVDVDHVESLVVDVIADTPYAHFIEFGGGDTHRPVIAEGRFLTPTVKEAGPQVQQRLSRQASNTIGGFPWSHTSR